MKSKYELLKFLDGATARVISNNIHVESGMEEGCLIKIKNWIIDLVSHGYTRNKVHGEYNMMLANHLRDKLKLSYDQRDIVFDELNSKVDELEIRLGIIYLVNIVDIKFRYHKKDGVLPSCIEITVKDNQKFSITNIKYPNEKSN